MKYVELFAGVGGFRLGIDRAIPEARVVFANEWDKYAGQTYDKNFGGHIDTRDITTISNTDIPEHDLLTGGFPCQTFSIAGNRAGFDETRGTMFFEIARILEDKRPRHLVLENVKGLLSHGAGQTFQTILRVLSDLGYRVEWQVLNSKEFGVPQNRERVFIIGHLRDECGSKIFPIITTDSEDPISTTLRAHTAGASARDTFVTRQPLRFLNRNQKNIEGDYAFTVDASSTADINVDGHIRRLTPKECERLQGFPDDWTAGVSDRQRYRQMGNAITVNVVEVVIKRLIDSGCI